MAAKCAIASLCDVLPHPLSFSQCEHYRESITLDSNWERAHFAFAQYLDQLYTDAKQREVSVGGMVCVVDGSLHGRHLMSCVTSVLDEAPVRSVLFGHVSWYYGGHRGDRAHAAARNV